MYPLSKLSKSKVLADSFFFAPLLNRVIRSKFCFIQNKIRSSRHKEPKSTVNGVYRICSLKYTF